VGGRLRGISDMRPREGISGKRLYVFGLSV
jgi:hypothetical protein